MITGEAAAEKCLPKLLDCMRWILNLCKSKCKAFNKIRECKVKQFGQKRMKTVLLLFENIKHYNERICFCHCAVEEV